MKRKEFKLTEEMKKDDDFNFAVYVYENTEDCIYVNDDSLEFLDEQRNLASSFNDATYFLMSYYTKKDITSIHIGKKTKEILLNVLKEKEKDMEILKSQGSYGYLLPVELAVEEINGKTIYSVGEDLESGNYSYEIFETIEEAEEAFERRLSARR